MTLARGKQVVLVYPKDADKHRLQDLIAVNVQIPSSKIDQDGLGIPFYSPRSRVPFDVAETIYHCCVQAKPESMNPLL